MKIETESTSRTAARSFAMGVLLSMVFVYAAHVLGIWEVENYRPDSQTTMTVLLHNKCAVFGKTHTLRPNTGISDLDDSIGGTRLSGSFMNFTDGHIVALIILSILFGGLIFAIRNAIKKNRQLKAAL